MGLPPLNKWGKWGLFYFKNSLLILPIHVIGSKQRWKRPCLMQHWDWTHLHQRRFFSSLLPQKPLALMSRGGIVISGVTLSVKGFTGEELQNWFDSYVKEDISDEGCQNLIVTFGVGAFSGIAECYYVLLLLLCYCLMLSCVYLNVSTHVLQPIT